MSEKIEYVFTVTYLNGKIYVGHDFPDQFSYFGRANDALIANFPSRATSRFHDQEKNSVGA
jgi:hypothetical protein